MKRVFHRILISLLLAALILPTSAGAASKQMEADVPVWSEEAVRQYALDYIGGRDMSRLWGYYDLQIRRYMPLSAFEEFLSSLEWMTGEFYELGGYASFSEPENELKTHILHLCMEKQDLDMYFTHKDKENDWEVMALQFVPAQKEARPSGLDMLVDDTDAVILAGYTETEVTLGTEAYPLKGLLTMPAVVNGAVPGCVIVHDGGALDMNGTGVGDVFYAYLAHALADMGIASIRYDKRTYTYGENPQWTAWEETVEDAILAGQLLKANEAIDPSRIVVVGHGLGAMLAPRIASQSEDVFTAMVMIGGTPKSYAQLMFDNANLNDFSAEALNEMPTLISKLPTMKEQEAKETTLFDRSAYYFWEMEQYDQVKLIKELKLKTYIVQGTADKVVSEDEGWRMYSEEIGDGITYVGFKAYRFLDHQLTNVNSTGDDASLDKSASKNIAQWILGLNQVVEE